MKQMVPKMSCSVFTDELTRSPLTGHFVATMAHQLRNPLAAMSSTLQLLLMRLPPDGLHREALEVIAAEMDRLGKTINDIVRFAPELHQSCESYDLIALLFKKLEQLKDWAEDLGMQIQFPTPKPPSLFVVMGGRELDQVLDYLLYFLFTTASKGSDFYFSCIGEQGCRLSQTMRPSCQKVDFRNSSSLLENTTMPGAAFGLNLCSSILRYYGYRLYCETDSEKRWIFSLCISQSG